MTGTSHALSSCSYLHSLALGNISVVCGSLSVADVGGIASMDLSLVNCGFFTILILPAGLMRLYNITVNFVAILTLLEALGGPSFFYIILGMIVKHVFSLILLICNQRPHRYQILCNFYYYC